MPQVPYIGYPTTQPIEPGEQISVSTPGAAFGENVGAAIRGIGGQLEQSGNEIFGRAMAIQDLANETAAREADSQFAMEQGKLHADFIANNPGASARENLIPFINRAKHFAKNTGRL